MSQPCSGRAGKRTERTSCTNFPPPPSSRNRSALSLCRSARSGRWPSRVKMDLHPTALAFANCGAIALNDRAHISTLYPSRRRTLLLQKSRCISMMSRRYLAAAYQRQMATRGKHLSRQLAWREILLVLFSGVVSFTRLEAGYPHIFSMATSKILRWRLGTVARRFLDKRRTPRSCSLFTWIR